MKRFLLLFGVAATLIVFAISCGPNPAKDLIKKANQVFKPLPAVMPGFEKVTKVQISLGDKLYNDVRLSVNDTQSCNTCHLLGDKKGGVDNLPVSPGALPGTKGDRNAPTVLNAGFHFVQFWDGRAKDLQEQAKGPILNPVEMGMPSEEAVVKKISAIDEYKNLFKEAFPNAKEPITYDTITEAIAAFESTLITKDRFDDFLKGDVDALSADEQKGLETFIRVGCTSCHNGPLLGGNSYQKMGLLNEYTGSKDMGRFDETKDPKDKQFFKVPSLRNIALTGPYFHNGSVDTLESAVKQMAHLQLNRELTDEEISSIVSFLHSLTDKSRAQ